MRTLVWSDRFHPYIGGGEILGAKLLRDLRARGHDIIVVTRKDTDDLPEVAEHEGISVHRFPFAVALQAHSLDHVTAATRGVARLAREFAPDLVHVLTFGPSTLFVRLASRAHRAPLLVSLQEMSRDQLTGPDTAIGSMFRSADWIVGCSELVLWRVRRQIPEIVPRSSVILNAVEMPEIAPRPLPFRPPRVLCAGRLVAEKGFDLAVEAFGRLASRFSDARLAIAGDGPRRKALGRQAARLGLSDRVEFLGWVAPEEMPALLNTATLLLMPSWSEGLPLVAIEAAQMGRPVVATRVGGVPEVVLDGGTGLLAEPGDVAGLVAAIGDLLEDQGRAAAIGAAARRRAREHFDWERFVDAYDGLYHTVCALGRGARDG